ncbi:unnamed protein product [Orchesella dallaii]|uniref:2'-5'-oligoadenylate synthetase 1 domain-containing protein n=1 Tax=Orchesella dallaii TaxID=48710 RepID=A0ABP1S662_9HEXA
MTEKMSQTEKHHQQNYTDDLFMNFGEKRLCDQKYYEDGKKLAFMVFNTLLTYSKCSLDNFDIGGSFGKKTDVIHPDLDLVVLVNNCEPPLDDILNHFQNILQENERTLQIIPNRYKQTELSLNFSFTNGITVDLIPAAKIEPHETKRVFKEMKHHKYAYFYNPSFVKDQIAFMDSQDAFTHTLIRLSKFWLKSLYLGESFSGGSAMMELIGVVAAQRERENKILSITRAFLKVLDIVKNLKSTKIAFKRLSNENLKKWSIIFPDKLSNNSKNIRELVPHVVGKPDILSRKCFMVDPANPFKDYLEDKTSSVLERLIGFAGITQHRIQMVLDGFRTFGKDILTVFEPIPGIEAIAETDNTVSFPKNILLALNDDDEFPVSVHIKAIVWKKRIYKNPKAVRAIDILKKNLLTVVHSTVKGVTGNVSSIEVKSAVFQLVGSSPDRINVKLEKSPNEQCWNYDVTILVPYVVKGATHTVGLSMTWDFDFPAVEDDDDEESNCCCTCTYTSLCGCFCYYCCLWPLRKCYKSCTCFKSKKFIYFIVFVLWLILYNAPK